jgi:uncharacterized protein (TIGR03067 family)
MRFAFALLALIGLLPITLAQDTEAKKRDLASLKGTWKILTVDNGIQAREGGGLQIEFSDDKVAFRGASGSSKLIGEIALIDPTKKPKRIDLKNGEDVSFGIYELKGEDLRLMICDPGKERPPEFRAAPRAMVYVLKREKK